MNGVRKNRKKLLTVLLCAAVVLAAIPFIISAAVRLSAEKHILLAEEAAGMGADCIIVLGAYVRDDGGLSSMLRDRMLRGIELYEAGAGKKLLLSGDHGRTDYDEVNAMKSFALERGVPEEDIFTDHAGFSTYESAYRAAEVFLAGKVIIVTQEYHLYRAVYDARQLGLEAYGVSSDLNEYGGMAYNRARELLARNKDFFMCIFQPKPTYLGDVIPISGDGKLTAG